MVFGTGFPDAPGSWGLPPFSWALPGLFGVFMVFGAPEIGTPLAPVATGAMVVEYLLNKNIPSGICTGDLYGRFEARAWRMGWLAWRHVAPW